MNVRATFLCIVAICSAGIHAEAVDLIAADKPSGGWSFSNGAEFPGATGTLTLSDDKPKALVLHGDFTKGGNYVAASVNPPKINIEKLSFRMKAPGLPHITVRIVDSTEQCHQIDIKVAPGDDWQLVEFPVLEFFKQMGTPGALTSVGRYEKWGGANDGKWHGPCHHLSFLFGKTEEKKVIDLLLRDVCLHPSEGVVFSETFEAGTPLPKGWEAKGDVSLDAAGFHRGAKSLKLARTVEKLQQETVATGPTFTAAPGPWSIAGAIASELNSQDNSYNGAVSVEALGADGKTLDTFVVAEAFKKTELKNFEKRVEFRQGTMQGRLTVRLNKADGSVWIDDLTATRLVSTVEKRIDRIEISTERVGNLLLPEDKQIAHVRVKALRELKDEELTIVWSVRDYWGAEQAEPAKVKLTPAPPPEKLSYKADLDLSAAKMDIGRYYEIHVEMPRAVEPEQEFSGIARLPEAATKKLKPEESPFTIRNWDNRITEYLLLSDRLGIRTIGLWCGFDAKPPYKPDAPGMDIVKRVGAKWISGLPSGDVEANGFKNYSEEALREGTQTFLKEHAGPDLGFIVLGNEPHGKIEKVRENVKAYRAVYEAVKKFDPKITVISTSVEPNEDYFKEGYHQWLDMYDFHDYASRENSYMGVRKTIRAYKELMQKYNAVKPIVSTELGMNSQGMPRIVVAAELIKTFVVFFAEGGVNASWFTIQYPDDRGQARGSSGDAHCVFDCKYNLYNPRIDAISYYTMLNGIGKKKFRAEKTYPDGTQAYLFSDDDGACMMALWNDGAAKTASVALGDASPVDLVWIDGRRVTLTPDNKGLVVGVSTEPVLLFFTQKNAKLPETMDSEDAAFVDAMNLVAYPWFAKSLRIIGPPLWKVGELRTAGKAVAASIAKPPGTAARKGRFYLQKVDGDKVRGEVMLEVPVSAK